MIPLVAKEGMSTCPLGFPMNQNRLAVPVWSYAMEEYPPRQIVELGSYNGGFTLVLGLHAWNIGAAVFSFDRMEAPSVRFRELAEFLHVKFYQGNIFDDQHEKVVERIKYPGTTYLLCDNGDKEREFSEFARYLKAGDIIGAHDILTDYWTVGETHPEHLTETVIKYDLTPWMQDIFDLAGWLVYRKL